MLAILSDASRGFLGDRRMPPLLPRHGSYLIRPFDPFRGCKLGFPRVRFLSPIKASYLLEWDLGITASDCLERLWAECPSTGVQKTPIYHVR